MFTEMEKEAMKNGTFNMAKDEGLKKCKEYRENLESQGFITWLEYRWGDNFKVEFCKSHDMG